MPAKKHAPNLFAPVGAPTGLRTICRSGHAREEACTQSLRAHGRSYMITHNL